MRNLQLIVFVAFLLTSCGSSRKSTDKTIISNTNSSVSAKKATRIVKHAKAFKGTRYKFGGTDKRGMDCSGLVYTAFQKEQVPLPRVSREMAKKGIRINVKDANEGDLVFFQTNKNRRIINHVGLVVTNDRGTIRFIHSTSSKGVIISSLDENYWKNAFVEARRII